MVYIECRLICLVEDIEGCHFFPLPPEDRGARAHRFVEEGGAHEFVVLAEEVHLNVEAEVEENGPILKTMAMALL